ncbi:MAG: acyl carrier protein [Victivallaceae bacterium]
MMEKERSMVNGVDMRGMVYRIVSEVNGTIQEKISDEQRLVDDIGMDSIALVELSMELENLFDISIPDDAVAGWKTVGDVVEYVEQAEE